MRSQSKHLRLHTSTDGGRVKWVLHADKRKLVILCLHGYLQNAEVGFPRSAATNLLLLRPL